MLEREDFEPRRGRHRLIELLNQLLGHPHVFGAADEQQGVRLAERRDADVADSLGEHLLVEPREQRAERAAIDVLQLVDFDRRHGDGAELLDLIDDFHHALHVALVAAEHDHVEPFDEFDLHGAEEFAGGVGHVDRVGGGRGRGRLIGCGRRWCRSGWCCRGWRLEGAAAGWAAASKPLPASFGCSIIETRPAAPCGCSVACDCTTCSTCRTRSWLAGLVETSRVTAPDVVEPESRASITVRQAAARAGGPASRSSLVAGFTLTVTLAPGAASTRKLCHWPVTSVLAVSGRESNCSSRPRSWSAGR